MPKTILEPPDMPVSPVFIASVSEARGAPIRKYINPPTINVVTRGITTTGINPASQRGTLRLDSHSATTPARRPVKMPPRKPAPSVAEIAPPTKPGAIPGRPAMP